MAQRPLFSIILRSSLAIVPRIQHPPSSLATVPRIQHPPSSLATVPRIQHPPSSLATVPRIQHPPSSLATVPRIQHPPSSLATVPRTQHPPSSLATVPRIQRNKSRSGNFICCLSLPAVAGATSPSQRGSVAQCPLFSIIRGFVPGTQPNKQRSRANAALLRLAIANRPAYRLRVALNLILEPMSWPSSPTVSPA